MTDLIIGCASNYTWDTLKYWVNSIRKTNFCGDIVVVGNSIPLDTQTKLDSLGVTVVLYPNLTYDPPHVGRFVMMYDYLVNCNKKYGWIITTDTKDVVFQSNPSIQLTRWRDCGYNYIFSAEGLRYKDEPWGDQNIGQTFGDLLYNKMREKMIYNVGVIAGTHDHMVGLMMMIYQLSLNRPIPIVDQAVFNFLINQEPYYSSAWFSHNDDAWGIQLGTTIEAVKSGAGDLGMRVGNNPSNLIGYQLSYLDGQPILDWDNVRNKDGQLFTAVHQYDRIPNLKQRIQEKYGD
jgi:hypothetical protein